MAPKPLIATQPAKAVYTAYTLLSLILRLPILSLLYLSKSFRPSPSWTWKQAILRFITKTACDWLFGTQHPTVLSLEPGAQKSRFVCLKPAPEQTYAGIAVDPTGNILPEVIGATWFRTAYSPSTVEPTSQQPQRFVLHFHGGAYVAIDGRIASDDPAGDLLAGPDDALLSVSYRLACTPGHRFPSQLQDAVTAYYYLLHDMNVPASKIILSGDSAGGNLVIALLRYIADNKSILPAPAAAILSSPWVDLEMEPRFANTHRNSACDIISEPVVQWGLSAFLPLEGPVTASNPYISPMNAPFQTKTPIAAVYGGKEILYDQILHWASNMRDVVGNNVGVFEAPLANHDPVWSAVRLGFAEEVSEAVAKSYDFLKKFGV